MASNIVWGLDIGSSAIKAVKMQRFNNECSIVDFDIIDIPGGDDPAERPARLSAAMKNLTETHKFGNDPVILAIPGAVCLHREFALPPGPEARVHEMVSFEARQQIPFPLDQVEWGYERFEANDESKAVNVTLIAVRKTDIQELLTLSENFGLKLAGISAAPVALYNFIHFEFKPQNIALILDAGARGTDFVVMNKRQIYFRSIQIAGREITRVLENKFKVPFDKAESLKKNIEKSPQMDQILTVIEPTLRNLGADVQRTIGFYKAKSRGQKIQQCFLLGHAFRLPKMAEYLQAQVREAPFALVEGLQRIRLGSNIDPAVWEHEFPTMAVAIGLGIQGMGLSEMKLNLLPEEEKSPTGQWKIWSAAAAAVLLVTVGVKYRMESSANAEYSKYGADLKDVVTKVEHVKSTVTNATKPVPEKKELNERLQTLAHDRGKGQAVYSIIPSLKATDGQPVFGTKNKIYLTNLYVSRNPLTKEMRMGVDRIDRIDPSQEYKRIYEALGLVTTDPFKQAPELRPNAPLLVVVSGHVEVVNNDDGTAKAQIQKLEDLLKALPQNRTKSVHTIYNSANKIPFVEHVKEYDLDGKIKTPPVGVPDAVPETQNTYYFVAFDIMLAWEDPDDLDRQPPVVEKK